MMAFRKIFAIAIATAVMAACGGEKGGKNGSSDTLVIAFDGSPTNLDPRVGTDNYSGRVWDMASSALIKLTPTGEFTGDIATKWETPDDRTIVFHLNPAAKFQDGRPVTSKDFKYTFDSMLDPKFL